MNFWPSPQQRKNLTFAIPPQHVIHPDSQMDELIEKSNSLLAERGFEPMPLDLYDFYRKSDAEIRRGIKGRNSRRKEDKRQDEEEEPEGKPQPANDHRGTKMVLRQYFNWLDSGNDPEVPFLYL